MLHGYRGEEKNGTEEWERLRGLGGEGKHGTKKSYSSVRPGVKIILSELFDNCGAYCSTNGVPA